MSDDLEDFREQVIAHAKAVAKVAVEVTSEAGTNASLVQPFLEMLGYDPKLPSQVRPEHHADFSDKYQNKVDYAIMDAGNPVIAIETKCVGSAIKSHRGQLRSYFNAASKTVRLGILTDGLNYEFYADSDALHMMDSVAFLKFDLEDIAHNGEIDSNTLAGIAAIRRGKFNPDDVGAAAKRELLVNSIATMMDHAKQSPSDEFVRFVLGQPEISAKFGKLTQKTVETNRPFVQAAIDLFVTRECLARIKDPGEGAGNPLGPRDGTPTIHPSDNEIEFIEYTKNRLSFLVENETLFREIHEISFKKYKKSLKLFYCGPNNGSIVEYRQDKEGVAYVQFPALGDVAFPYSVSTELDDHLLRSFAKRVVESGITFEPRSTGESWSGDAVKEKS